MNLRIAHKSVAAGWLALAVCLGGVLAQSPKPDETQRVDVPAPVRGKKLILKNGTFQTVRSWERTGDRVRYYSVERSAWEEIPADMVDFAATERAEAEEASRMERAREEIREAAAIREAEEINVDASVRVAPGVFLPEGEGMFALDCPPAPPDVAAQQAPAGKCKVLEMTTLGANVKTDKKRTVTQVLAATIGIPLVSGRQRVTVPGKQAALRLSSGQPEFFVRVADNHEPEMELIVAKLKGSNREIDVITQQLTGEKSSKRDTISVERWPVAKRVYRLTMSQTLPPGEYVLAEVVPAPEGQEMNLMVWDFGVDGPAPAKPAKK